MRRKVGKGVLLTAGFSLLLTCVFYLAHDGVLHNSRIIGWQAYTAIDLRPLKSKGSSAVSDAVTADTDNSTHPSVASSSGSSAQYDDIYPLDFYAPLLPNPAPITEITVKSCLPLTRCQPKTTPAEDALLGKWVQVDRSLSPAGQMSASAGGMLTNIFGSIEQRFLFYRKSRRRDVQNVVEIRLVEEGEPHPSGDDGWHRVKTGLRSKVVKMMAGEKSLHLYYRTKSPAQYEQEKLGFWKEKRAPLTSGPFDPITELDLVYGDNPPWPGFESAGVVSHPHSAIGSSQISLSFRRKPMRKPPLEPLKFRPDGTFKILQLADLHFSVNPEPCRDTNEKDPRWAARGCLSKNDTLALVDAWLDSEKPDMVVLTGDQLNGQGTSWDPRSVLSLYTAPLIKRQIPYAVILGNHDSEAGSLTREEQMQLIQNMPYSYSLVGPALVTGAGNYYLKLHSPGNDRTHVATLWFMDSGTHADKDKWKPWTKPGYGYIRKDQLDWFEAKYTAIKQTLQPYRPDGAQDLGPQWRRRSSPKRADKEWDAGADQNQALGRPPSVLFMHIPVPEAFNPVDHGALPQVQNPTGATGASVGRQEMVVGSRNETATFEGAQAQPGIFDLVTSLNRAPPGVRLLVHGHMHLNSDCRRVNNVWICFGGGASYAAYGKADIQRRARVIEFREWGKDICTYHRIASSDPASSSQRFDDFVLPYSS
ncbi:phosphatase dcr2 [Moesziomyces antarcticus]|uniref:Related to DCR2 - dosage-dependent cell cycle regulator n=2 Tax=Pseudozyma antarctica TaxID=84753 RepID=A0A5C3FSH2_PSEA2|nr:phosphatase dcr2 [Moesziomyces antarcticus]GAK65509.1 phosphatase dcr2 [Moesziomyces antarcticus]SPO46517.1 related to DCR2 - dosage-dependent cell cycle regulator [Moesziomyces antarcticus]